VTVLGEIAAADVVDDDGKLPIDDVDPKVFLATL
jgi:hypothetical protein